MSIDPSRALSAPTTARVTYTRPPATFVAPIMTMAEDAKRCTAAMRRHNGAGSYTPGTGISPAQRQAQINQRAEWFAMIRAQLKRGPMTLPQIRDAWGMSKGAEVQRIKLLEAEGYVKRIELDRVYWGLK